MATDRAEITVDLVRTLLKQQFPDLADLNVTLGARGWDNQIWRLGEDLAVRMPWATDDADALLLKEYEWLPTLAANLPLAVPVPQQLGQPSAAFPRLWVVATWVPGKPADLAPIHAGGRGAISLAAFLDALHQPAPAGAPTGRGRGGPLTSVAEGVEGALDEAERIGLLSDPDGVRAVWRDALSAPEWSGPPTWLHGDLHPANVLTDNGELCGVIDFGDLCVGDPALDLGASWMLLPDREAVRLFWSTYNGGADEPTWRRARGWAVWRAVSCLFIAEAGRQGKPGGQPTWGPPARAALEHLTSSLT